MGPIEWLERSYDVYDVKGWMFGYNESYDPHEGISVRRQAMIKIVDDTCSTIECGCREDEN